MAAGGPARVGDPRDRNRSHRQTSTPAGDRARRTRAVGVSRAAVYALAVVKRPDDSRDHPLAASHGRPPVCLSARWACRSGSRPHLPTSRRPGRTRQHRAIVRARRRRRSRRREPERGGGARRSDAETCFGFLRSADRVVGALVRVLGRIDRCDSCPSRRVKSTSLVWASATMAHIRVSDVTRTRITRVVTGPLLPRLAAIWSRFAVARCRSVAPGPWVREGTRPLVDSLDPLRWC